MANSSAFTESGSTDAVIVINSIQSHAPPFFPEDASANAAGHSHFCHARSHWGRLEQDTHESRTSLLHSFGSSFAACDLSSLFIRDGGETYNLIKSRNCQSNAGCIHAPPPFCRMGLWDVCYRFPKVVLAFISASQSSGGFPLSSIALKTA